MRVLIACEVSGRVRDAFRDLGHDAWSCDILGPDSDVPGFSPAQWAETWNAQRWPAYHLEGDALWFTEGWAGEPWDLMIAHPPCTYLTNAGVRWMYEGGKRIEYADGTDNLDLARYDAMDAACTFFARLWCLDIPRVAIENPIMHGMAADTIDARIRELRGPKLPLPQIIQPWQFGDPETKATCLWTRGLPALIPTHRKPAKVAHRVHMTSPGPDRWYWRSRTPEAVANAFATQWGSNVFAVPSWAY